MNKLILQRIEALESSVTEELYGIVTFTDGITARLSMLEILGVWRDITAVKWLESSSNHGLLPEIVKELVDCHE